MIKDSLILRNLLQIRTVILFLLLFGGSLFAQDPDIEITNKQQNIFFPENTDFLQEIQLLPTEDPAWDVYYAIPDRIYRRESYTIPTRELLKSPYFTRPTAIFVYGSHQTYVFTNRTVMIKVLDDSSPFEYLDEITSRYPQFLKIFCRIPYSKNYDRQKGKDKLEVGEIYAIETECDRKLISKTWKGRNRLMNPPKILRLFSIL